MADISQRIRNLERFTFILKTLSKYGLAKWAQEWSPEFVKEHFKSSEGESIREMPWEKRVRLAFTELGTTFIKLGQVMSTRADLVGTEVATELEKLQADTPTDPPESVRATIEAELGKPPEQLFAEFDDVALASASIGQVHVARLTSGEPVVVKVQHPGIDETVEKDLEVLGTIAGLIEKHSPVLRPYRPRALVAEFRRNLLRELDFNRERRNLEEFARNFRDDPTVHFPIAYPEFSTQRVLTMERLDGTPIADTAALEEKQVDNATFAWNAATVFVEMIFRDGFYHADPHPGNIMSP